MNAKGTLKEYSVHIIGPNNLQNELLKDYLVKETGITCSFGPNTDIGLDSAETGEGILILYDCLGKDVKDIWGALEANKSPGISSQNVAFFNLNPDIENEKDFLDRGIRGVFHMNEPLSLIPKGVMAMLNGEMWYSRKTLSARILEPDRKPNTSLEAASSLTAREKEILIGIAAGNSNDEIANDLFISPHTVKTHIYNIYKKINISNRLQAMLWVAKYL